MTDEKQQRLKERLLPEIEEFKQSRQTLLLASTDAEHNPNVSYAPFALANGGFYILISDLAKHGKNLKQKQGLSVMLVQDETEAKSIFARKRLTFEVQAEPISRDNDEFAKGRAALIERFGEMAENLSGLSDFNMYKLTPSRGLFVKGFGQAFQLTGSELTDVNWMTGEGKGHGHRISA